MRVMLATLIIILSSCVSTKEHQKVIAQRDAAIAAARQYQALALHNYAAWEEWYKYAKMLEEMLQSLTTDV